MSEIAAMSFEEAMKALEDVVRSLESGNVELEKSIALYERGAALKAHCEQKLKEAEERSRRSPLPPASPLERPPPKGFECFPTV